MPRRIPSTQLKHTNDSLVTGIGALGNHVLVKPGSHTPYFELKYHTDVAERPLKDRFIVLDVGIEDDVLLGRDWINKYQPTINWRHNKITGIDTTATKTHYVSASELADVMLDEEEPWVETNLHTIKLRALTLTTDPTVVKDIGKPNDYKAYRQQKMWKPGNGNAKPIPSISEHYKDFSDVFQTKKVQHLPPHRPNVDHEIELMHGKAVPNTRVYSMSLHEEHFLKDYIDQMLSRGFIRKSKSPGGAGIVFAAKANTTELRVCVDYRGLNKITIKNRYPLPLIESLLDKVRGAKWFVKIDLMEAYYNIRIKAGDEYKTAFKTPWGLFEYLVMPFGLCNAPATFQAYVDKALHDQIGLELIVYLDDILIFANDLYELRARTKRCLQRLRDAGLFAKLEKCIFEVQEVSFLGYIISDKGISMDSERIQTILDWRAPRKVRDVQAFIGFINFFRRFIFGFSRIIKPITDLLKKQNIAKKFSWPKGAEEAFNQIKEAFKKEPLLRHFDPLLPLYLWADASGFAIAAILYQSFLDDKQNHPIAFWSRKLTPAERNYGIPDQELLAIWASMMVWRRYLEGAQHTITVFSDHANLQTFNTTMNLNRRQVRWSLDLQRFDFTIHHVPGRSNPADGPSRRADYQEDDTEVATKPFLRFALTQILYKTPPPQDIAGKIKTETANDDLITEMAKDKLPGNWTEQDGLYYWNERIYVPKPLRLEVIQRCHDSALAGHYGSLRTTDLVTRTYYWPKLTEDVEAYCERCEECQKMKTRRHAPYGLLQPLGPADGPWIRIGIDLITDLPTIPNHGWNAICVVIDHFTKMAHFIPAKPGQSYVDLLIQDVVRLHGVPQQIVSDRDVRFMGNTMRTLGERLGFKNTPTTSYHAQTDGQTERVNSPLEAYLRIFGAYASDNWSELLPLAEFAYNNSVHATTNCTPFFANYGRHPRIDVTIPGKQPKEPRYFEEEVINKHNRMEKTWKAINQRIIHAMKRAAKYYNSKHTDIDYKVGDLVLVNTTFYPSKEAPKKLDDKYEGPYQILEKVGTRAYRLDFSSSKRLKNVHPVWHVSLIEPWKEPITSTEDLDKAKEDRRRDQRERKSKKDTTEHAAMAASGTRSKTKKLQSSRR